MSATLAARDWDLWTSPCRIVVADVDRLDAAIAIADGLLAEVEIAASRFRPDSELLNLRAGWNDLSPMLADLVREALTAAWLSDGAVDPTVGATMAGLGYDRTLAAVRAVGLPRLSVVPSVAGWRSLRLDGSRLFRPADVQLDLGATAKAVAADRTAAAIADALGTGVLVSLGGDIATSGPAPDGGWQVTVQDLPTDAPQQVTLNAGAAVATSSTAKRTWQRDGRTLHHLVDPATGAPTAGPWRAVTVVATDCARANTASTGAIVKGHKAMGWLRGLGFPARLTDEAGRVRTINGFPEEPTP
jgi:thiamine biosynthesis lipoprotein